MSATDALLTALQHCPEGVQDFISVPIPDLTATTLPNDIDSAIITQGVLAHNLNSIFMEFVGLTPIQVLLRIGQHNSTLQAALLAGLEYVATQEVYDFEIVEPDDGATLEGETLLLMIRSTSGTIATAQCEVNNNSVLLEQTEDTDTWLAECPMPDDPEITLLFSATFQGLESPVKHQITVQTS